MNKFLTLFREKAPTSYENSCDFQEVLVRVGRKDILDLQYNYGFILPASIPVLLREFSIGTGFGFKTGYNLRFRTAVSNSYTTTFISAEALLGKNPGLVLSIILVAKIFIITIASILTIIILKNKEGSSLEQITGSDLKNDERSHKVITSFFVLS